MSDAVGDIVYLGQRLKGLIELSDKLTTQEALSNQITELQATAEKAKSDIDLSNQQLADTKDAMKAVIEEAKTQANKITDDASSVYAKAKSDADQIIQDAKQEVDKIMADKSTELDQVNAKIKARTDELYLVAAQVDANLTKLRNAEQELNTLREKL